MRDARRDEVDPLVFEALVGVVERAGASLFRAGSPDAEDVARLRAITLRIVLAALASPEEAPLVPAFPHVPGRRRRA